MNILVFTLPPFLYDDINFRKYIGPIFVYSKVISNKMI